MCGAVGAGEEGRCHVGATATGTVTEGTAQPRRFLLVMRDPVSRAEFWRLALRGIPGLVPVLAAEASPLSAPWLEVPGNRGCLVVLHLDQLAEVFVALSASEPASLKRLQDELDRWRAREEALLAWVEDQRVPVTGRGDGGSGGGTAGILAYFDPAQLPPVRSGAGVRLVVNDEGFAEVLDTLIVPKPVYRAFVADTSRSTAAYLGGHGDICALIAAGPANLGGIAPGCTVWLHKVLMKAVTADPTAPPEANGTTLELLGLLSSLEATRAAGQDVAEAPLTLFFTPLQFDCTDDAVRGRCQDVLAAYAEKLRQAGALWLTAAGNGGRSVPLFPARVPGVIAVAYGKLSSDGRWVLGQNSGWYDKAMLLGQEVLSYGWRPGMSQTSGASSLAAGLGALMAASLTAPERTADNVNGLLFRAESLAEVFPPDGGTPALGMAHVVSLPTSYSLRKEIHSMSDRKRQASFRKLYKSLVSDDSFWQSEDSQVASPMTSSLAHQLHAAVRDYGKKWPILNLFDNVAGDAVKLQALLADMATVNAVVARAMPDNNKDGFALTHDEIHLLYKLMYTDKSFAAIAPYDPPTDPNAGGAGW